MSDKFQYIPEDFNELQYLPEDYFDTDVEYDEPFYMKVAHLPRDLKIIGTDMLQHPLATAATFAPLPQAGLLKSIVINGLMEYPLNGLRQLDEFNSHMIDHPEDWKHLVRGIEMELEDK